MGSPRLRDPLRRPVFRRLALSYALNEMGDWMGIIALSVLVFDQTGSAVATAVLFLATQFLPGLVVPVFVAKAEQPPPRVVLPVIYCGEAAVFACLALLSTNFSLAGVVVLASLDGILAVGSRALTRAVVVSFLEPTGELRTGNAILNLAYTWGAAIGPAIAGVFVAAFGVQSALLLDAASFCAMGWLIVSCKGLPHPETEPGTLRERVRAGLEHIRGRVTLRRLLLAQAVAFVFFAAVIPIEVIFAKETLGVGDTGYGILLASWGGGMVVGGFAFATMRKAPLPILLFLSTVAVGVSYLGLAVAPTLLVACAASVLGGSGNGVQWVGVISAVQELTGPKMQARVLSVLESLGAAMPGVGYLLGGLIAAGAGPRMTFLVAGIGVLAIVSIAAPLLGTKWPLSASNTDPDGLDSGNEVVVELIPASFRGGAGVPRANTQPVPATMTKSEVVS
jgi:MFS family permease